ncbi:MAG TPA: hypothetical protein VGO40_12130 [Longimicrobium sp.]|jgi:hypothetical protein|nr:hypothetical protein [Longimicrobium sp.]
MPRDRSEVVAALKNKGFEERPEGKNRDHDMFFFVHGGLQRAVFTKVSRGSGYRTIGDDLLGKMAKQLQLTRGDFNLLVECPLGEVEYAEKLAAQGVLRPT